MSKGDYLFLAVCFGIVFLFQGEPDLWDKLHDRAMTSFKDCK